MAVGGRYIMIDYLKKNSELLQDKVAIVCENESITFGELYKQVLLEARMISDNKRLEIIENVRSIDTIIRMLAAAAINKTYRIVNDISEVSEEDRLEEEKRRADYLNAILYEVATSGTTGKKKIVKRRQYELVEFIKTLAKKMSISSEDVILNQLDFTFDASSKDIYMMVILGATLCIGSREKLNFPKEFINTVNNHQITVFQTTPFFIKNMARFNAFSGEVPKSLKLVMFVGDVMKSEYLNYWIDMMPDTVYVNLYGISEETGNIMYHMVKERVETEYVPLSKMFSRCRIIIDDITGLLSFRNDHYRPEIFTGDIARRMTKDERGYAPGHILIMGRSDNIRKIRGYRISLEEIEQAIASIAGIENVSCEILEDEVYALCEVYEDASKELENKKGELDEKKIRRLLNDKLPSYCQPIHVKKVDLLPANINGKPDRKSIVEYFMN